LEMKTAVVFIVLVIAIANATSIKSSF
jgi:hypothetical protein